MGGRIVVQYSGHSLFRSKYISTTMAVPALAMFDVPILVAHLFVFYFDIFAIITPPVALVFFVAAGLASGDPMRTSMISLRLSIAGF
ncbi:TRAP transporter large permease subunit [Sutcliffiella rhizosphaerae]|nr:TRAP transporter large permease subunit [Sutcliffiella rhizosphaerae]